jgi:hypothetical protein
MFPSPTFGSCPQALALLCPTTIHSLIRSPPFSSMLLRTCLHSTTSTVLLADPRTLLRLLAFICLHHPHTTMPIMSIHPLVLDYPAIRMLSGRKRWLAYPLGPPTFAYHSMRTIGLSGHGNSSMALRWPSSTSTHSDCLAAQINIPSISVTATGAAMIK